MCLYMCAYIIMYVCTFVRMCLCVYVCIFLYVCLCVCVDGWVDESVSVDGSVGRWLVVWSKWQLVYMDRPG